MVNLRDRDNLRRKDKRPVPKASFVWRFDCRCNQGRLSPGPHSEFYTKPRPPTDSLEDYALFATRVKASTILLLNVVLVVSGLLKYPVCPSSFMGQHNSLCKVLAVNTKV